VTTKAEFNADEWTTLVEAPLLAGMRVVRAGRGGTIRESLAIGRVYNEARQRQGASELLDALVASPPAIDPQRFRGGGDLQSAVTSRLQEALRVLEQKGSPEEVASYKEFILAVAQAAAEAHKEGGFIGIGGKPVSPEEQAALDDLRTTLDGGGGEVSS
jgi:hypothetical protein